MSDKQVVLAIFPDEAAADAAVASLKSWDKANDDIKLNAIGVLVLDKKGKVKTHKLGRRSVGKGAGIGVILAVFVPPSLLAGAIAGGVLGALHHKNLGLEGNDRDRLAADLANGKAAVGVLVAGGQATGGVREAHRAGRANGGAHGERRRCRRGRQGSRGNGRGGGRLGP